jgi:hypothetical protein
VQYDEQIVVPDTFSGDGTTTVFTLSAVPEEDEYSFITINGVSQHIDAYSVVADQLTFTEAPAVGDAIEVRTLAFQSTSVRLRDYKTFVFKPSTTVTTLSGADANGEILTYDVGKIAVYVNGTKLVEADEYTASNRTSIVLVTSVGSSDTVEIQSFASAYLLDWDAIKPSAVALTTTATEQTVDSFFAANYRTAKYIISMSHGTAGYHSEEILLLHDGTDVYMTTYAQIWTIASLGTITADISAGVLRLKVTPVNINTTIKAQRITVTT